MSGFNLYMLIFFQSVTHYLFLPQEALINSYNQDKMAATIKKDVQKEKIQKTLREVLTVFCKNALDFNVEISVEALIGITIDKDNVLLVNVNEIIQSDKVTHEKSNQHCLENDIEKSDYNDCEVITIKDEVDNEFENLAMESDRDTLTIGVSLNPYTAPTSDNHIITMSRDSMDTFNQESLPGNATVTGHHTNAAFTQSSSNAGSVQNSFQESQHSVCSTSSSSFMSNSTENCSISKADRLTRPLNQNRTLTSGKTVLVCSICTKVFVNKSAFSRHKRIHTSPAFVCNCGASFYRRDNGKAHVLKEPGHFLVRSIKPTDPLLSPGNRT